MHVIHQNVTRLSPKIDTPSCKINKFSFVGISETKHDWSVWNIEIVIETYDVIRLDRCGKESGVTCFIRHCVAYNYKANMCLNTERIFTEINLPKSKPFIVRLPDRINYVNCIVQIFSQFITLETEEYYLFGDFTFYTLRLKRSSPITLQKHHIKRCHL